MMTDQTDLIDRTRAVCFTGHRMIPDRYSIHLRLRIQEALSECYQTGYRFFLCGGALGFDTMAAQEILEFRKNHAGTKLIIVVPCRNQAELWPEKDRRMYRSILEDADDVRILSEFYSPGCMQTRNRYLVDHASLCICYMTQFRGGTWSTVRYAIHSGVSIVNLAVTPFCHHPVFKETVWNSISISHFAAKNASIVHLSHSRRKPVRQKPISNSSSWKQTSAGRRSRNR